MANVHRLPGADFDDRRLIDVTMDELLAGFVERFRDAGLVQGSDIAKPLDKKGLKEHYGVSDDQVYKWRDEGMPCFCTGEEKGLRANVADVDRWLIERKKRG